MTDQAGCCQPGDIIVTPVHGGFMLGRSLPERGQGPWWEYLTKVATLRMAMDVAREMAGAVGTKAWFQTGRDTYRAIPLDSVDFMDIEA